MRASGRKAVRAASTVLLVAGFGLLVVINATDMYAQYEAETNIERITSRYPDIYDAGRLSSLEEAHAYNDALGAGALMTGRQPYMKQLAYGGGLMMSYIEVPDISVKLPVYHGTAESELMAGIGHLEGSSLPVGGESSHCVLLGHSGMRNTRMFDDLHKLESGDVFVIWTLSEPYAYRVYASETVEPDDVSARIGIVAGEDLVTLITCTPYGVNSHRLLVHAARCEYSPEEVSDVGIDAYVNGRNLPLLVALAVVAAIGLGRMALSKRRGIA